VAGHDLGRSLGQEQAELLLKVHLVPGAQLEVRRPNGEVEAVTLYQVEVGRRLYLAADWDGFKDRSLEISFVVRDQTLTGQAANRYGFRTRVVEFRRDFEVSPFWRGPVIVTHYPNQLELTTLRHHYRAVVPAELGLRAEIQGLAEAARVVDLSLGDCRLAVGPENERAEADVLALTFRLDRPEAEELKVQARVVHASLDDQEELLYLGLSFVDPPTAAGTWLEEVLVLLLQNQPPAGLKTG